MNDFKSHEFNFLYLVNKTILLFKYIDINDKQKILYEIKLFINKLQEIFLKADFNNPNDKKNKIYEILIQYFQKIINDKLYKLLKNNNIIIKNIDYDAIELSKKHFMKSTINIGVSNNVSYNISNNDLFNDNFIYSNLNHIFNSNTDLDNKNNSVCDSGIIKNISIEDIENKIEYSIKNTFSKIENNIKSALKDYFSHTEYVEYDLDKKFNGKLNEMESKINNFLRDSLKDSIKDLLNNGLIKEYINNSKIYDYVNSLLKTHINELYIFLESYINKHSSKIFNENIEQNINLLEKNNNENKINIEIIKGDIKNCIKADNFLKIEHEMKNDMKNEIETKILMLTDIFNKNIQAIINSINDKLINSEKELFKIINENIDHNSFKKNNFNINFDKETNEIKLFYFNELITSTKINIKGLIGPKGPPGNKGDKGDTPIIRKIGIQDGKFKFIIQDTSNIYEILTDENIPTGPMGPQGLRGEPGKSFVELKWEQDNVMRIDKDNMDSLIFLKSLCVGEKSHCLKNNSMAIGGGICYNTNSFSIGNNSKTLDNESVAFYGSTIGKKAFAYRADNIDENMVCFGKKSSSAYDIQKYNIFSKEINFECDTFRIKTNNYENNKFKELEEKIIYIEKKLNEISKKI